MRDRLTEDLKAAMKRRDQLQMDVIRMVKAAILNKEIELKKELDESEMNRVMTMLVKQRRDAADQYQKANRAELADKEYKEIHIIERYLPQALSSAELAGLIERTIEELGAQTLQDMGAVMKAVLAQLAGQAVDGKQVSEIVRRKLS